MDGQRFDALTRALAAGTSRRRLLHLLGGGAATGLFGLIRGGQAVAADCAERCNRLPAGDARDQCLDACAAATQTSTDGDSTRAYAQALRDCDGDASRLCGSGTAIACCAPDETCSGGACVAGSTPCPTGQIVCGDTCVDIMTDPKNCGECDNVCGSSEHGQETCNDGNCGIVCDPGFSLCDRVCCPDDAVCQDGNCTCPPGACGCPSGLRLCPSGCIDVSNDPNNCGRCEFKCTTTVTHGIPACGSGQCGFSCENGYTICGATCCPDNLVCVNGICGGGTCPPGQEPCHGTNGEPCTDVMNDPNNCGDCGNTCETSIAHAHPACQFGRCWFACDPGFVACGEECVPADNPPANCATCGHGCIDAGHICCAGSCTDILFDPHNCGRCGEVCDTTGGRTCINGACRCPQGTTACASGCIDITSDLANCGACGHACGDGQICRDGHCLTQCDNFFRCPDGCTCRTNEFGNPVENICITDVDRLGRRCSLAAPFQSCPAGEICITNGTNPPICGGLCGAW